VEFSLVIRYLGIDLGSTYTRLVVFCPETKDHFPIENPKSLGAFRCGYEDFPSDVYVFDDDGEYYSFSGTPVGHRDRPCTSAKFLFYLLARRRKLEVGDIDDMSLKEMDALLDEYPLVQPVLDLDNDADFVGRVRDGLHAMFSALAGEVQELCAGQDIQITEVGLTIPTQWDLNFEDVYRDVVANAFETHFPYLGPSGISFLYETEALANLILTAHLDAIAPSPELADVVVLFLDFGGHNMVRYPMTNKRPICISPRRTISCCLTMRRMKQNGCIYNVINGETFARINDAFGTSSIGPQFATNLPQATSAASTARNNAPLQRLTRINPRNRRRK
jgi:hypothetical protein